MKRTPAFLVCTLAVGWLGRKIPDHPEHAHQLNTMQQNHTAASNEALGIKPSRAKPPLRSRL